MSSIYVSMVWTNSRAKGVQKLAALALAEHADRKGVVELSVRDVANLCGVSKTRADELLSSLIDLGEVRVIGQGGGRGNPRKYWITLRTAYPKADGAESHVREDLTTIPMKGEIGEVAPVASTERIMSGLKIVETGDEPLPGKVDERPTNSVMQITQTHIDQVLAAAGIRQNPEKPFFWARMEHRADLGALLDKSGHSFDDLLARLREARSSIEASNINRLSDLLTFVGKAGAA